MAEFIGIRNENEFYFAHYLTSLMDDELKEECQNETLSAACEKLLKLGNEYFEAKRLRERVELKKGATFEEDAKAYLGARARFMEKFAGALGYAADLKPGGVAFAGDKLKLPLAGLVRDGAGRPQIALIESRRNLASAAFRKEASTLGNYPAEAQLRECEGLEAADREALSENAQVGRNVAQNRRPTWENLLGNEIFAAAERPRFAVVFGEASVLLADATKWAERRSLRFDLDEIYAHGDRATARAMACLLHRDSLAPNGGTGALPDKLDANSHKNAFGVSKSLRYAMREAIEDLGNAIIAGKPEGREITAADLSRECIMVMYRFLFILFMESRKDLKYFGRNEGNAADDIFWSSYGLDHLRDMETTPLLTESAKNGLYFDKTIKQLFAKIWEGENAEGAKTNPAAKVEAFKLVPIKAHLFDPARTPLFNESAIPNRVWQKIVYSLSIGETGTGRHRRKGRISYARLGIGQLGAVYEALLSYTGFYAKEDLYEVHAAGGGADGGEEEGEGGELKADELFETGYFITESELGNYSESEIVAQDGRRVCHKKGSFIYRMAGRDRKRSASYYTPNELTRCLVRLAIAERVTEATTADEIMRLTVCEPAMGSAAFLNEMVEQLAELYLARKEKELGRTIPLEERAAKKARVKTVIADNNVFGVDLNPMAADLAEVSLWLGTIGGETEETGQKRDSLYIPWFGNQLTCGNSIVGARREAVLADGKRVRVGFGEDALPRGAVWHFLLPCEGMGLNLAKEVKAALPGADAKIKAWKKSFRPKDAGKKSEKEAAEKQRRKLLELTKSIDALWRECAKESIRVNRETLDDVSYFGHESTQKEYTDTSAKDRLLKKIEEAEKFEKASATFRMRLLLDIWCSLWFWPLDKLDELPSYEDFLSAAQILAIGVFRKGEYVQPVLMWADDKVDESDRLKSFRREPTFERLFEMFPFIRTAREVAARQKFLHWELAFARVFAERGGFDFVIGNPPWVKLQWEEAGILSEYDARIAVRKISAAEVMKLREGVFGCRPGAKAAYLEEYATTAGAKAYLNDAGNYPALKGVQTNLFKFFLPLAFDIVNKEGVCGYVHPEGVYDDPNGGKLRAEIYPRLRLHAQFINELKLFDIDHHVMFGLNIYGPKREQVGFENVARLYHPNTLLECRARTDAEAELPLERNAKGGWNVTGHPKRIVKVDDATLKIFAALYDEAGTPRLEARLPQIYAQDFIDSVLPAFDNYQRKMGEMEYCPSVCWDETGAPKAGIIRRETGFPAGADEAIYSGPHFFLATPFNKCPRPACRLNSDYDNIDLTAMGEEYLPRTNYVRAVPRTRYFAEMPSWNGKPVAEYWRVLCRGFVSPSSERSLMPIFAPKGWAHVNTVIEFAFNDSMDMSELTSIFGAWMSLPFDWFFRSTGKPHLFNDFVRRMPALKKNPRIAVRALLLNCLTRDYGELWGAAWEEGYRGDGWLSGDVRLTRWADHLEGGREWAWGTPLRTALDRRQALVELDVLAARELGLRLEDLLLMYRVGFAVLRKYDGETYYDMNGRCVFSVKGGESPLTRAEWEGIKDWREGEYVKKVTETAWGDEPREREVRYRAPFFRKDREADYREAWGRLEGADAGGVK